MGFWRALKDLFDDREAGRQFAMGLAPMFAAPLPPVAYGPLYATPHLHMEDPQVQKADAEFWARIMATADTQRAWDDLLTEPKPWGRLTQPLDVPPVNRYNP